MIDQYVKNTVFPVVVNVSKSKIFACIVSFILGIVSISIYDSYVQKLNIEKQLRVIDSLRIEINYKDAKYKSLKVQADSLDSAIVYAKNNVKTVIKTFPYFKRPPVSNLDTATKFIRNFIKE